VWVEFSWVDCQIFWLLLAASMPAFEELVPKVLDPTRKNLMTLLLPWCWTKADHVLKVHGMCGNPLRLA
jgi:hypothetical protein